MANFRVLCLLAAGTGCYYTNAFDKLRSNIFKVKAQPRCPPCPPNARSRLGPARPQSTVDPQNVNIPVHKSELLERLTRFGLPERDFLLEYEDFEVSYDNRNRIPNWVLEHLTYDQLRNKAHDLEQGDCANPEDRIHCYFQSSVNSYRSSGYEKGHLVSGKNHKHSQACFNSSCSLATIAPMHPTLKCSAAWNDLEAFVRYLTSQYKDIYVYTGPLFFPEENSFFIEYEVIGAQTVSVPTHYFKIIIGRRKDDERKFALGCYLLPNNESAANCDLTRFHVSLSELERKAGFKLFDDNCRPFSEDLMTAEEFIQNKACFMVNAGLEV